MGDWRMKDRDWKMKDRYWKMEIGGRLEEGD
jgi:hypothetical protein